MRYLFYINGKTFIWKEYGYVLTLIIIDYILTHKRLHIWNSIIFIHQNFRQRAKIFTGRFRIKSLLTGLLFNFFLFSLISFVPDARFFAFSSTDHEHRDRAANFWQLWYNITLMSQDYASFFVNPDKEIKVTPTIGVSLRTDSRQSVEVFPATPSIVQTSRTSSGKNVIWFNRITIKSKQNQNFRFVPLHSNYIQIL